MSFKAIKMPKKMYMLMKVKIGFILKFYPHLGKLYSELFVAVSCSAVSELIFYGVITSCINTISEWSFACDECDLVAH